MGRSAHVPNLLIIAIPPASSALHVIFLQRLPEATRTSILESIRSPDQATLDWFKDLAPVSNLRPRNLIPMPWIRDQWATSSVILEMCAQGQTNHIDNFTPPIREMYTSFVLVDSGWDAGSVIVAHWTNAESAGGQSRLEAARVPMGIANLLLTLLDNGSMKTIAEVLGQEGYEAAKVDFYQDLPTHGAGAVAERAERAETFEPPLFLQGLCISATKLYIIALTKLDSSEIDALENEIFEGDSRTNFTPENYPDIQIVQWQGPSPDRSTLANIVVWLEKTSTFTSATTTGDFIIFFADNILRTASGSPQILAASLHPNQLQVTKGNDCICLQPIGTEYVADYWQAAYKRTRDRTAIGGYSKILDPGPGQIRRRETILDIWSTGLAFGELQCCPVFFLRNFSPDEERRIRCALSAPGIAASGETEEEEEWLNEFFFAGYLWPSGDQVEAHTMTDLRDLLETCEPVSPTFKPDGRLKFKDYPTDFVVIDDRALDSQNPHVILASPLLDRYEETNDLGWRYGVVAAANAYLAWSDLAHAFRTLDGVLDGEESYETIDLLHGDLKAFEAEEWEGDMTQ